MDHQEFPIPTAFTTPDGVQRVTAEEYLAVRQAYNQCRQDYADLRREMREGLRDQFAAAAMQGFMADHKWYDKAPDTVARDAYEYADAMLAAREAKS